MNKKDHMIISAVLLAIAFAVTSCSSNGDSGPAAPVPTVSIGAMTKGSVIVNGVTFQDPTEDRIHPDDTGAVPVLDDGKMVKIRGTVNADGLTGQIQEIEVENEVRGAIEAKVGDTITVLGQTVLVDGSTVFANASPTNNLAGLAVLDNVEVHGQRDVAGVIRATRVEELGAGAEVEDEVRGTVSNLSGAQFNLGSLLISFGSATIVPPGQTLANGMIVEVHLSPGLSPGTSTATRVEIEDLEDDEFEPGEGQEFEVEGLISAFGPGTFKVGGESVQTTASTRFEGGLSSELANDVKVEAEGHLQNGVLVAEKITFKENIRIEANATAAGSANALGLIVHTTSKTEFPNLSGEGAILPGGGLKMRGFLNLDGSITATRVESQNPVNADRSILQGPALNVDATAKSFKIGGITILASTAVAKDDNDATMSQNDFFAAISARTMIVKVRGQFANGVIAANEMEIE